jgi:hypothetical protein
MKISLRLTRGHEAPTEEEERSFNPVPLAAARD